jgi:hypothetical protein
MQLTDSTNRRESEEGNQGDKLQRVERDRARLKRPRRCRFTIPKQRPKESGNPCGNPVETFHCLEDFPAERRRRAQNFPRFGTVVALRDVAVNKAGEEE